MSRPAATRWWIGDTVYLKHDEDHLAGTVVEVSFVGDAAYPLVRYEVSWGACDESRPTTFYEVELTPASNFQA